MASLREIRRKIKSVKSTQQITKAMKMVAAARLRRAQTGILSARPFAQAMERLMTDLLGCVGPDFTHPLLTPRKGERRLVLLVTSDKGLCGAFNTNLVREAIRDLRKHGTEQTTIFVVGRKGRDAMRRFGAPVAKEYLNIFNQLSFAPAEVITQDIMDLYLKEPIGEVDVIYSEFKSVIQQRVVVKPLLPLSRLAPSQESVSHDFLYEPAREVLLEGLMTRFLKAQMYRVLLESYASELGARMTAMDNATRNARELMSALTLQLNRTRQASITKEILEVVSGAEALK